MSKPYENIFEYLEVFDPEEEWIDMPECYRCGSYRTPLYGPARELTNPDCRSGWWVTVCVECREVIDMHL